MYLLHIAELVISENPLKLRTKHSNPFHKSFDPLTPCPVYAPVNHKLSDTKDAVLLFHAWDIYDVSLDRDERCSEQRSRAEIESEKYEMRGESAMCNKSRGRVDMEGKGGRPDMH